MSLSYLSFVNTDIKLLSIFSCDAQFPEMLAYFLKSAKPSLALAWLTIPWIPVVHLR